MSTPSQWWATPPVRPRWAPWTETNATLGRTNCAGLDDDNATHANHAASAQAANQQHHGDQRNAAAVQCRRAVDWCRFHRNLHQRTLLLARMGHLGPEWPPPTHSIAHMGVTSTLRILLHNPSRPPDRVAPQCGNLNQRRLHNGPCRPHMAGNALELKGCRCILLNRIERHGHHLAQMPATTAPTLRRGARSPRASLWARRCGAQMAVRRRCGEGARRPKHSE